MWEPLEGWIAEKPLCGINILWNVKGYYHPDDALVAIPYRHATSTRRYEHGFWRPLLLSCDPSMLSYIDCIGVEAPLIRDPVAVFNPFTAYKYRRSDLPHTVASFLEEVEAEVIGITGSWLAFHERLRSDVDILLYSKDAALLLESLKKLKRRYKARGCRSERSLWPLNYVERRILELCFDTGERVTIRILRRLSREPCRSLYVKLGWYNGPIHLDYYRDESEAYLVPARYLFRGDGLEGVLETWRTSYQELVPGRYLASLYLKKDQREETIVATPDHGGFLKRVA